ncbi:MAG: protein-L-isoaspartate O-methyltransferase [Casimicrobiaceae bacterium]
MDIEQARFNMVEQQIRTWEVLDPDVLDLLFVVKREDFVPPVYRALAFADLEIPLPNGERMWTPKMEARVLQELRLARGARVLEIGTGSGYFTALLAAHGAQVTTVEIDPALRDDARARLARAGHDAEFVTGDGARGWGDARYDAIVLTGSTPVLADAFRRQVNPGGRIFAVIGDAPAMKARILHCVEEEAFAVDDLFETVVRPLRNAATLPRFVF